MVPSIWGQVREFELLASVPQLLCLSRSSPLVFFTGRQKAGSICASAATWVLLGDVGRASRRLTVVQTAFYGLFSTHL